MPRTGLPVALYYGAVVALLALAGVLPRRPGLAVDALAALAAGSWCTLNFWRCRHAHCAVSGAGWLGLGAFTIVEAGLGHSVIGGNEQPVFLGVLGAALAFEAIWYLTRGTNAIGPTSRRRAIAGWRASAPMRDRAPTSAPSLAALRRPCAPGRLAAWSPVRPCPAMSQSA
jgi:hypothetical protein